MSKRTVSGITLTLLLIGMLTLAFSIQEVKTEPNTRSSVLMYTRDVPTCNMTYGGDGNDSLCSMVQTGDGGFALAGSTQSTGSGVTEFWLVKTDADGTENWNKTFMARDPSIDNEPTSANPSCATQTSDGGYAIFGTNGAMGEGYPYPYWLVKTDSSGNGQWNYSYAGAASAGDMIETEDGGYVFIGYNIRGMHPVLDVIKTDSMGIVQWWGTPSIAWSAPCLVQTSDGNYVVLSSRYNYEYDFGLTKLDPSGNILWERGYNLGASPKSLVQAQDGGFVLAGSCNGDFSLMKMDALGNLLWNNIYGFETSEEIAYDNIQTSDGGFALAGSTDVNGDKDFWLVRTDEQGNLVGSQIYGGTGDDEARSVVQTGDGKFVLAGSTNSFGAGGYDFWLVKTAAKYRPIARFSYSPTAPIVNDSITFDASTSSDFDGQVVEYRWNFDDETSFVETEPVTTHSYTLPGNYIVTLTVIDDEGLNNTFSDPVSIDKVASTISILATPSSIAIRENAEISGSITPSRPDVEVTIWCQFQDAWTILTNVTTDEKSKYTYVWTPVETGNYTIKASWSGDNCTYPNETLPIDFVCANITSFISISTSSSSTFVGFRVNVTGTLKDMYGNGLKDETVVLYYTFSGIVEWVPITSDTTDDVGHYFAMWIPPATGYFVLKAEWAGNATHSEASNTTTLSSLAYQDEYILIVESNSTVSELAFNTKNWKLSFSATGLNGTRGYVKVTVAKSLVSNITNIRVYLDGRQSNFSITSTDDSWLLTFTYMHSTHQVEVDLDINIIPELPSFLILPLFMIATLLAVIVYKRKHSIASKCEELIRISGKA